VVHPYIQRMAKTLIHYSLSIQKGDKLLIRGSELAAPLILEAYREAIKAGAHVSVVGSFEGLAEIFYKEASDEQLEFIDPLHKLVYETYDAMLGILGAYNTRALSGIDPSRQAISARASAPLLKTMTDRSAADELKWCATIFPTHASAQDANMSLSEYEEFVYRACHVDEEDPVAKWKSMQEQQDRIIDAIKGIDTLRIVGEDTDLTLRVKGRKWISAAGERNFPDGEIFTGPIEDSANGHIRFSFPGIRSGKEIEDIRLTFQDGKVVESSAKVGEDLLKTLLNSDPGASYLGEIGIGTNYGINRFTRNILFDEKIGGTIHLAVGSAYPETGGKNQSGVHWDMLCDLRRGGEIYGDGDLIYKDGKFVI